MPCISSYTQCYTHQYAWCSCILNFVLFPNLILATWHSKMLWHVILWILSEWHWQHYQHYSTLTALSTEFPPSMLCNSRNCSPGYVLHPTDDRASQKSHQYPLQNTDTRSNLRTGIHYHRKRPNNIILSVSVPKCEKSLLNIYERPFFGKFLFAVSGEYILKQWWLLGSWEQWQSTKCCSEA